MDDNTRSASTLPIVVEQTWLAQPGWMAEAECQYTEPNLFFPEHPEDWDLPKLDGRGLREMHERIAQAKWVCGRCPVRERCLDYALETENPAERWGIWGGLTASERDAEAERRSSGAPCATQAA